MSRVSRATAAIRMRARTCSRARSLSTTTIVWSAPRRRRRRAISTGIRSFARSLHLRRLRRDHAALRRGRQVVRNYAEKPGLFAVSRIDPQTGREIVIAFNTSTAPIEANVEDRYAHALLQCTSWQLRAETGGARQLSRDSLD